MAIIAFDNLIFTTEEDVIVVGLLDDATATTVTFQGNDYPLTDSTFSFNLGKMAVGRYGLEITITDGDSAGEIINQTIEVTAIPEVVVPEVEKTEEEILAELGVANDPSPDFIPDYKPFEIKDTNNITRNEGSRTGFEPIETSSQKFPERRNIQETHPVDGLFADGRKADLVDEPSDSPRLTTRSGGMGSPISTTGFTF